MKKDSLKKIYFAHRVLIFPLVVILSALILIVLVIYPQTSKLINNYQTENQLNSKSQLLEGKVQALENVNETDLNNKLALAMDVYPSDRDFASVIGVLQNVISRYGFIIVSLHIGGGLDQSKSASPFYYVNLEIMGPKTLLTSLVDGIENSPRIMKMSSVQVSSSTVGDNASINISVQVFYQTLPSTFGNVDSPLPTLSERDEAVLARLTKILPSTQSTQSAYPVPKGKSNPFQ